MIARVCLAAVFAFIIGGALRIEQGDLVVDTAASASSEIAASAPAEACPENDDVPYTMRCLAFLKGSAESGPHWQADTVADAAPAPHPPESVEVASADPTGPACPSNDNVPYSARCLVFLKGATESGMRWRIR
jgi:hypothetical protein